MDAVGSALQLADLDLALAHTERLFLSGDMRRIFKAMHRIFADAGYENEFRALQKTVALQRLS